MNGFITFLSNNYIYFLIAAGVLAFALVGFLVDIKKKKDAEASQEFADNAPIPNVAVPNNIPDVNNDAVVNVDKGAVTNETLNSEVDYNPAPPMPEQPIDMGYDNPVNVMPNMPEDNVQSDHMDNQMNQ